MNDKNSKIIIVGGGNHALSVLNILFRNRLAKNIIGYLDEKKTKLNIDYLGKDKFFLKEKKFLSSKKIKLAQGIGTDILIRTKVFNKFKNAGYSFLTMVDKSSIISFNSKIGEGTVIFPNSSIGPNCRIEENIVLHTNTTIEHDVEIGSGSYIGPSATLCGNVKINKNCLVGAASCILENIVLPKNSILGAISLLNKNYKASKIYKGIPAK
jgi:sugar O-acyltransferase (sialic acid O-acetyltransferase NeuD family)